MARIKLIFRERSYNTYVLVLSKRRITKTLIRLRRYAGWSAPELFAIPEGRVFLRRGPYNPGKKSPN